MSDSTTPLPRPEISRTERIWLFGAVVFGAALRLCVPWRIAIEHFDEGVYASNFWFGGPYPAQHLYAPPLLPTVIEWTMFLANVCGMTPTGIIPVIPCLIAGIAMIPSIWWVGRQWFGPAAGVASAWLVATSDFHASYSRAALTDVPVCLFILWAAYFGWLTFVRIAIPIESLRARRKTRPESVSRLIPWREIIFAGGLTGLAWWTKYNGWLPLAICFAGGALWQILTPCAERQIRRSLACCILIAGIAAIVWSPVLWSLQSRGGYAAVAANHRGYVVGLYGWGDSAIRQAGHIGRYENFLGMLTERSGGSTAKSAKIDHDESTSQDISGPESDSPPVVLANSARITPLAAAGIFSCVTTVMMLVVVGMALWLRIRTATSARDRIGTCLLAAWYCGLTVATPFYHPYPRLVLPWLVAIWIGTGLAIQLWRNRSLSYARPDSSSMSTKSVSPNSRAAIVGMWTPGRAEWFLVAWVVTNCVVRSIQGTSHAWQDRTCFATAAANIAKMIAQETGSRNLSNDRAVVFVYGEPALVFGLRAQGLQYVLPIQDFDVVRKPVTLPKYLVCGQQLPDQPGSPGILAKLEPVDFSGQSEIHPSHLVEMDSLDNGFGTANHRAKPKILLFRIAK